MRFVEDESGQVTVFAALFMGVIAVGLMSLAIDAGTLFRAKISAQTAADAAAFAAASELGTGYTADEQTVANGVAKLNGFDTTLAQNPATVTLTTPTNGTFANANYVQATVSMPIQTLFWGAFRHSGMAMPVSAAAIAGGGQSSQTCVCLEGTSGEVLNLSNGSKLTGQNCGVVDNSSSSNAVGIIGSATLNAMSLGTVSSSWDNSSNINNGGGISSSTTIIQGIPNGCSPSMPAAPSYTAASCLSDPGGSSGTYTVGPSSASGTVCYKALTVGANGSSVTLNPGIYVITGALHFESGSGGHSNQGGNGVFFYLTGTASLSIDNGANVSLTAGGATSSSGGVAPTVGSYNGLLFYQDANDTSAASIQGGSSTYMNGAIYAPGAAITLGNGSGAIIEGGLVANSLTMNGGGTLTATTDMNEGSLTISSPRVVQ